jgi:hypothetical protein
VRAGFRVQEAAGSRPASLQKEEKLGALGVAIAIAGE